MHRQKPPIIHRDLKVPPPATVRACTTAPSQDVQLAGSEVWDGFSREDGCRCFLTSKRVSGSFSVEAVPSPFHIIQLCGLLGLGLHAACVPIPLPTWPLLALDAHG